MYLNITHSITTALDLGFLYTLCQRQCGLPLGSGGIVKLPHRQLLVPTPHSHRSWCMGQIALLKSDPVTYVCLHHSEQPWEKLPACQGVTRSQDFTLSACVFC